MDHESKKRIHDTVNIVSDVSTHLAGIFLGKDHPRHDELVGRMVEMTKDRLISKELGVVGYRDSKAMGSPDFVITKTKE